MQFVSCHNGQIFTTTHAQWQCHFSGTEGGRGGKCFKTELLGLDDLLPNGVFARGAIHEILSDPRDPSPRFIAMLIARSLSPIVWCDADRTVYPPALAAGGIEMKQVFLLHPRTQADQSWAIAECMRCKGVGATIAQVGRLTRLEARRLQLSAERGGGIGLLLRPMDRNASVYAAATRWLVGPMPGLRTVQRWKIQLIHAHGGRIGQTVLLEHCRETNTVRVTERLVDGQSVAATNVA